MFDILYVFFRQFTFKVRIHTLVTIELTYWEFICTKFKVQAKMMILSKLYCYENYEI